MAVGPIRLLSLLLMALCFATAGSVSPALAARGHVFGKVFGEAGAGNGQFEEAAGVAVSEASGDVYVVDQKNDRVERFSSSGGYLGQFNGAGAPTGVMSGPRSIAIDNSTSPVDPSAGDVYVYDFDHQVIDKFDAGGAYVNQVPIPPETPQGFVTGIAVNASGQLWVDEEPGAAKYRLHIFDDAHENASVGFLYPTLTNSLSPRSGLAIDGEDDFYLRTNDNAGEGLGVAEFNREAELLNPRVEGETASGVAKEGIAVESATNDVYLDNIGIVQRIAPDGSLVEAFGVGNLPVGACPGGVSVGEAFCAGGIAVNSKTGQVYVAESSDAVAEFPLEPPGEPRVEGESLSEVTSESASFSGEVNPRGVATTYHFEYGSCASSAGCAQSPYEVSVPLSEAFAGSDFEVHDATVHVQGLLAHTPYHFRIVARNSHSPQAGTVGTEQVFVTQQAGGSLALPDGRAWELVSPADKHGALIEPIAEVGVTQAAADGGAITYLANAPTETQPQGYSREVQVLSTRGSGGWESHDIALPDEGATGYSLLGDEYRFFSSDLSSAVVQPIGAFNPSLSQAASEQTPYLRSLLPGDPVAGLCAAGCYRPLVTGCPQTDEVCASSVEAAANVPTGTSFGEDSKCPQAILCGPRFLGASEDDRHIVFRARASLLEGQTATEGLYEWSADSGRLTLVSVLPDGKPASAQAAPALGDKDRIARNAISADGSRVIWSESAGGQEHLYLSDTSSEETIKLDTVVPGASGGGPVSPRFQLASRDGSKVFFTDGQALTTDSGTSAGTPDLYECEIIEGPNGLECDLSDLTPASGEPASVQGVLLGAAQDGSSVYFVANEAIPDTGARAGDCDGNHTPAERCNLYIRKGATTRLVTALSGADASDWAGSGELNDLAAGVSPDGEWLAFMSELSLTGYDNRDASSGKPDEEVYLYDAAGDDGAGSLVCASCDRTGARPHGTEYLRLTSGEGGITGGDRVWPVDQWLAANIPGWTPYAGGSALYQSRFLSDSGRLFFNSADALEPQDTNGNEDVYEYEPSSTGTCTLASSTFEQASNGCVGLISSGSSPEESAFLDASESGSDVFFLTSAKLAQSDFDTSRDVYDAHQCTATSPCTPGPQAQLPACTNAEACRAAPALQPAIFGSPASATFTGMGDLAPSAPAASVKPRSLTHSQKLAHALKVCRKRKLARARVVCARRARARYAAKLR